MTQTWLGEWAADLKKHEGLRLHLYRDPSTPGYWTIGYGHCVDRRLGGWCDDNLAAQLAANGYVISGRVAEAMLYDDILIAYGDVVALLKAEAGREAFDISAPRLRGLGNMAFQMGRGRLRGFKKMWRAIADLDWGTATKEALDSVWAEKHPARADAVALLLKGRPV